MNTLVGETGNAGAVAFGGPQKTAPANPCYTVGEIGFGPTWSDDEPSLREMYDAACQTIVRLECEADELRAEVAMLREGQKILGKLADARASHLNQVCDELGMGDGYIAVDAAIMAAAKIKRLQETVESLRDDACREKCRDKAAADGGWANI